MARTFIAVLAIGMIVVSTTYTWPAAAAAAQSSPAQLPPGQLSVAEPLRVALPRWEFGAGIGAVAFADYRGADSTHVYALPLPYFIYRGRFLRADRGGLRSRLFARDDLELTLSASATTPVRSHNNRARMGMPDLKPTVELGPAITLRLWRSTDQRRRLEVRGPLRAALSVESSPRAVGYFFAPTVNFDISGAAGGLKGWQLGALAGPLFADRRYHDYFYGVAAPYRTATRPTFRARAGYGGTQFTVALSKHFEHFWLGTFLRYDSLAGAVFDASPLVRTHSYWSTGIGVAWQITESSQRVSVSDSDAQEGAAR